MAEGLTLSASCKVYCVIHASLSAEIDAILREWRTFYYYKPIFNDIIAKQTPNKSFKNATQNQ